MSNGPPPDDELSGLNEADREAAFALVKAHLERFYRDEPNNDIAADNALLALANWRERWKTSVAFRIVIGSEFPLGALKELVLRSANRLIRDDSHAREFLQKIYSLSSLDAAVNFDELV
jgi:hypothetical protein